MRWVLYGEVGKNERKFIVLQKMFLCIRDGDLMRNIDQELDDLELVFELADDNSAQDVALVCRQVLEKVIDLIFEQSLLKKPINATLIELINNDTIQNYFNNDVLLDKLHFIRILGINAYHHKHIKSTQAKVAYDNTRYLLDFIKEKFYHQNDLKIHSFTDLREEDINEKKTPSFIKMNEAETRKVYIDLYLEEAGWEVLEPNSKTVLPNGKTIDSGTIVPAKACSEIPVHGLSNASGLGFCDYVLYGKDGKPLAIVEAKKTSVDPIVGQQQVREYGKCMEKKYGYVPILYYTNGYEIHIIDGKYPPRKVAAFHTIAELSYLIQKRSIGRITDFNVNQDIAGRPYQKIAITSICERFNDMHRRGLLVMATGTGKTRTAIALVELLTRNNFIKNVLFLADRTSLVRQAFRNFQQLLPEMTYCVLNDRSLANEPNARITFSTHQTMINFIDDEEKEMSVGRFDLIIIDEAHRSIFNKYGAIFSYFDSLLVGLTATPKDEVDANTYGLFNCESGVPNFSYSLKEAVEDHYLVPYKLVNRTSKQLENGINYNDLSDEDKLQVNMLSDEEYDDGDIIDKNKLFKKIFNKDTCRRVLEDVMEKGLRIEQGQILGKTIIFAVNHYHAKLVVETFNEMYPMYPEYCKLIDNQVKNSEHLIDEFEEDPKFRIAVSVDMLDTGIDVPSVLNLVFFKRVNSTIKLIQMIGRGTRLCEGLIDGKDKKYFLIFDYFNNLKDENPENIKQPISITQKIFGVRLKMMCEMQGAAHQTNEEHRKYYIELKKQLIRDIKRIKDQGAMRISVRAVMNMIDKYYNDSKWEYISLVEQREIEYALLPLVESDIKEDHLSLAFDLKMLQIENIFITEGNLEKAAVLIKNIRLIAQSLLEKAAINEVRKKIDEIEVLYSLGFWEKVTIEKLEYYRKSLRLLMKFLRVDRIVSVIIDNIDEAKEGELIDNPFVEIRTYKEKVMDYLIENSSNPTIQKIKNLEPLTEDDFNALEDILWVKLGSKEDYYSISKLDNLAAFIRSIVGINQEAINEKLSQYLNNNTLSAEQMEFIYSIINYVRENGDITGQVVIEEAPFDNFSVIDLFDTNAHVVADVVNTLHNCIIKV